MKKTVIITIIFSLLSVVSTFFLFDSMNGFKTEVQESKIAVKEMHSQINSIENKYKQEIEYWLKKNNSLQQQIIKTENALDKSKQKTNSLQWKIQNLIKEENKVLPIMEDLPAGQESLEGACDSLKEQVTFFIAETTLKDSLFDTEISQLKTAIQNKDSALVVCERGFVSIRQTADFSLAHQTALAEKLNTANEELKKQNRRSKIVSAGIFVLSGVTATLLLTK